MGVSLTEKAAEHVNAYLQSRGKGVGIRLAVKTTGCSGLMYVGVPSMAPSSVLCSARLWAMVMLVRRSLSMARLI